MYYFAFEKNQYIAIQEWNNSQFDLCDIVLSLTDNGIIIGSKIYYIFCRPEILNIMQCFVCDLNKIKEDLGIIGNYIERSGNVYFRNFNPKRNNNALSLPIKEMKKRASIVYKKLMFDLQTIANAIK